MTACEIVILAAGKGTRMKSAHPKVLQRLGGRTLLAHVLTVAGQLNPKRVVVVTGQGAADVERAALKAAGGVGVADLKLVRQEPQLGTGHAVQQAIAALGEDGVTLVLYGDVPLTTARTLTALVDLAASGRLALLTVTLADPSGYGRVVRGAAGAVQQVVEQKDATEAQRAIHEIYSGIMAVPTQLLRPWLSRLTNDNAQREYYLTDVVSLAVKDGTEVVARQIVDPIEVAGVNSPLQLAELERAYQLRRARELMEHGVRLADPARFDVRDDAQIGLAGEVTCAADVEIDVGCVFTGHVEIGEGTSIGAYCCIANATIGPGVIIQPFSHIDGGRVGVQIGKGARVGPFSRLRPGARLGADVHVGNFVEVKNSTLARGAKANHLAYLGDATVGERVNYGAGSITANYDGVHKHQTVIEEGVHVGSNCVLVAPVKIGAGGTVGAGSVVTTDAPPGALTLARGRQVAIEGWVDPATAKHG